ncbi:TPA: hypothetical protein HA219_00035 [Candidatus Woesearchaeota archaeon]|nr:hypothetical protein [Candidatus Woesearchaeota archaeon]HIH39104.1 hypothetical protein [Candidatus Woesearchaeota archaeon]
MKTKCPCAPIEILPNREIVNCDNLKFKWKQDPNGYFLVKIENNEIRCGFCTPKHKMMLELRSKNPDKIIKEIVKRNICNKSNLGYIASELTIAHNCIVNNKRYRQR